MFGFHAIDTTAMAFVWFMRDLFGSDAECTEPAASCLVWTVSCGDTDKTDELLAVMSGIKNEFKPGMRFCTSIDYAHPHEPQVLQVRIWPA